MEKYLGEIHQTVEHKKQMQDMDLVCKIEFNGSTTMKDIHILVYIASRNFQMIFVIFQLLAAETFDKKSPGKFMRLVDNSGAAGAGDEEPADSSPHIVAELVDK